MMLSSQARFGATALLAACVLCVVMWTRALLEARAELGRAQGALAHRDEVSAIVAYRRAARWNAPGNPYASQALASLGKLAASFEARGEFENALASQRAIHAAIHASSGFMALDGDRLRVADERIAALMAKQPAPEIDASRSEEERRASYLSLLRGRSPNSFWVMFALLGCVTWVVSAAIFLLRGVDQRGRVVRRIARRSGLMLLLGWIAFALGLRLA